MGVQGKKLGRETERGAELARLALFRRVSQIGLV